MLTRIAAAAVIVLVLALSVDYAIARYREWKMDPLILALQKQVEEDASKAPTLAAEQKKLADARLARKARITVFSYLLIAAAAAFIVSAKRQISGGEILLPYGRSSVTPTNYRAATVRERSEFRSPAPELDLSFVDQVVEREGRTPEAAIPILQAIQAHYRYLPDEALRRVCELTTITPAQIAGTSSFYAQFRRSPVGKHVVRVCHGTACHVSGARQITEELRRSLHIPEGADTDPDRLFTIDEVACLGCCSLAPVLMMDDQTVGKLTPTTARDALDQVEPREPA